MQARECKPPETMTLVASGVTTSCNDRLQRNLILGKDWYKLPLAMLYYLELSLDLPPAETMTLLDP